MTESELAWSAIQGRLRPIVEARMGAGADADDVLQEVLLKVHQGVGGLRDETKLVPWMSQVTRRAVADHWRQRSRHPLAADDSPRESDEADGPPGLADDWGAEVLFAHAVRPFVDALPEPYRTALTWVDLDGLTQAKAAERAGVSLSGMKSRVQRGRRLLRERLEACCAIELDSRGRIVDFTPRRRPDCCSE